MKIVVYFLLVFLLFSNMTMLMSEVKEQSRQKKPTYILCQGLTKEILEETKISTKKTESGIIIVITSPVPGVVKEIQNIIFTSQKKRSKNINYLTSSELLLRPKVQVFVINLNNGIRLELSSDINVVISKIHKVYIPGYRKTPPWRDH